MQITRNALALAEMCGVESPIEATLLAGIFDYMDCSPSRHAVTVYQRPEGRRFLPRECAELVDTSPRGGLFPQVQVGPYRVDFLLVQRDGSGLRYTAIECDGHDFHERTKEQAVRDRSRDRALQRLGIGVHRYTGSEIWSDPIGVAAEVLMKEFA